MTNPITFNVSIGSEKPHSGTQKVCPFCHPENLTHILDQRGDIIWLMNKYPVFEKTVPTVIVETADHDGELSTYAPEKLHEVIAFGLAKWKEMESDKRFRSVIYFRNFGPTSGGSQRHPHSQIIGLKEYDYRDNLQGENFLGEVIYENDDCYASLAEYPLSGVGELNVTLKRDGASDGFADTIQTLARYVLSDFPIRCSSYNIFFYHLRNQIHAKIFRLAKAAFAGRAEYPDEVLYKWLRNFYWRFFAQQFKRSCLPDGPKIGSVTLSPRGDWRMPSDACAALWLAELEQLFPQKDA